MQGMAQPTPVIYIGSFSKTLFPALRIGYMVLPATTAAVAASLHELLRGGNRPEQQALALFYAAGFQSPPEQCAACIVSGRPRCGLRWRHLVLRCRCWVVSAVCIWLPLADTVDDVALTAQLFRHGYARRVVRLLSGRAKQQDWCWDTVIPAPVR